MLDPEIRQWIVENRQQDPTKLRLKYSGKTEWVDDAICHIENSVKARRKFDEQLLPGWMPVSLSVEQSTSSLLARHHVELARRFCPAVSSVLDMTCGLGIDAAAWALDPGIDVTACELNPRFYQVAAINYGNRPNMTIVQGDSVEYLRNSDRRWDLIFIDPARRDTDGNRVYNIHDCQPDIAEIKELILAHTSLALVKLSPMLDIKQTIRDLNRCNVALVQAAGTRTECKELLVVLTPEAEGRCPLIEAWTPDGALSFHDTDEREAIATYVSPKAGQILYEPWAPVMKTGCFKYLCNKYDVSAVNVMTHLYLSDEIIYDFPGNRHLITEVMPFASFACKKLSRMKLAGDVTTRNFPLTATQLASKLNIKSGKVVKVYGITDVTDSPCILITQPQ